MAWKRFVAIGDSLTEGVGDPVVRGGLRGWADHLAAGLRELEPDLTYVNLARRSLRTAEINAEQVPVALDLKPDLLSAVMGMNDLIRPDFDGERFRVELSEVIRAFVDRGSTVLMASLPDVSRYLLARERIKSPLRERLQIAADVTRQVAAEQGALFVDGWNMESARSRDVFSIDRLHPNARGHMLIARAFAELLGARNGVHIEVSAPGPGRVLSVESALHLRWLARNVVPAALRQLARSLLPGR